MKKCVARAWLFSIHMCLVKVLPLVITEEKLRLIIPWWLPLHTLVDVKGVGSLINSHVSVGCGVVTLLKRLLIHLKCDCILWSFSCEIDPFYLFLYSFSTEINWKTLQAITYIPLRIFFPKNLNSGKHFQLDFLAKGVCYSDLFEQRWLVPVGFSPLEELHQFR